MEQEYPAEMQPVFRLFSSSLVFRSPRCCRRTRRCLSASTWFSCHSNTPLMPHLFHGASSNAVMAAVAASPATRPCTSTVAVIVIASAILPIFLCGAPADNKTTAAPRKGLAPCLHAAPPLLLLALLESNMGFFYSAGQQHEHTSRTLKSSLYSPYKKMRHEIVAEPDLTTVLSDKRVFDTCGSSLLL